MTSGTRLFLTVLTTLTALAVAQPATTAGKPETLVTRLKINSSFSGAKVLAVGSDVYADYRLTPADPCVQGDVFPLGTAIVLLNRKLSTGLFCNENGGTAREYKLLIESLDACLALGYFTDTCSVIPPADQSTPQARAESVFKNKATRTPVKFLFTMNGMPFTVTTDVDASIMAIDNTRTVTYNGMATLAEYQGTHGYVNIASFTLPFQIAFERVALP